MCFENEFIFISNYKRIICKEGKEIRIFIISRICIYIKMVYLGMEIKYFYIDKHNYFEPYLYKQRILRYKSRNKRVHFIVQIFFFLDLIVYPISCHLIKILNDHDSQYTFKIIKKFNQNHKMDLVRILVYILHRSPVSTYSFPSNSALQ